LVKRQKTNLERLPFPELVEEFAEYYKKVPLVEESKQETLEEFRSYYIEIITVDGFKFNLHEIINYAYNIGVKFQQEQDKNKYSEEEVEELLHKRDTKTTNEWFDKYKKK
jgi:hypothetical protein